MKKAVLLIINSLLITFMLSAQTTRYWVNGSGNWDDTKHWSEQSGGVAGASVPDERSMVIIDNNSGKGKAFTINVKQNASCQSVKAIANVNIKGKKNLSVNGDVITEGFANFSKFKGNFILAGNNNNIFNSASKFNGQFILRAKNSTYSLETPIKTSKNIVVESGGLQTNDNTVEANKFITKGSDNINVSLGASQIFVNEWNTGTAENLKLDAGSSLITVAKAVNFKGGDHAYNEIKIPGSSKAIGSVTITPTDATCPANTSGTTNDGTINVTVTPAATYIINLRQWSSALGDYTTIATLNGSNVTFTKDNTSNKLVSGNYQIWVREVISDEPYTATTTVGPTNIANNISVFSEPLCYGGTLRLTANPTGGAGTYTSYVWKNNSGVTVSTDQTTGELSFNKYVCHVTDANSCIRQESYTYIPGSVGPEQLSVSGVSTTPSCQGESNGTVTVATVTGGTPDYSYALVVTGSAAPAPGDYAPGNVITGVAENNYDLYVSDANGCTVKYGSVVTVAVTLKPTVEAGDNGVICVNETYNVTGTVIDNDNTSSYIWTHNGNGSITGETTATPTYTPHADDLLLPGQTVTLTITAYGNGACSSVAVTDNLTITINDIPSPDAGLAEDKICSLVYTVNGTRSDGSSALLWEKVTGPGTVSFNSNTIEDPTITASAFGVYEFKFTETVGNCSGSDIIKITFVPVVQITNTNGKICEGQTFNFPNADTANVQSILWTNMRTGDGTGFSSTTALHPVFTPAPEDIANGSVQLRLTGYAIVPCADWSQTMTLTIYQMPNPDAGADDVACGQYYTLNATPEFGTSWLNWSTISAPAGGAAYFDAPQAASCDVYVDKYGEYVFELSEMQGNMCTGTSEVTIEFVEEPKVTVGPNVSTCMNTAYTLPAGHTTVTNGTVLWTHNGTGTLTDATTLTPTYTPGVGETGIKNLNLKVTGIGGCSWANIYKTVKLTINSLPNPSVATGKAQVCLGSDEVYTTQAGMNSYLWSVTGGTITAGAGTNSITVNWTTAGAASVNINYTDGNGCTALVPTAFAVNVNNNPQPDLSINATEACESVNLALDGNPTGGTAPYVTHAWTLAGSAYLTPTDAQNTTFNCGTAGSYNLRYTVTDNIGCTGYDEMVVTVIEGPVAYAGLDTTICSDGNYKIQGASISNAIMVTWDNNGGDGYFDDNSLLDPVYYPGELDRAAGFVTLSITAHSLKCGTHTDDMILNFAPKLEASIGGVSPFIISASTQINVSFWGNHAWPYDLGFYLVTPDLQDTLRFYNHFIDEGGAFCFGLNSDIDSLTFTNDPLVVDSLDMCALAGDLTGVYQPRENWSKLYGQDPAKGGWMLLITDGVPGGEGFLTRGRITFKDLDHHGVMKEIVFDSHTINEPILDPIAGFTSTSYIVPFGLRTNCFGSCDAMAIVNVVGGTPPYVSYIWDDLNGSTGDTVLLCGGDYNVTVTDSRGCTSVATISVLEPDPVEIVFDSLNIACYGDSTGMVKAIASSGIPPYTYLWNDGSASTTAQVNNLPAGTYTITVTDANLCPTIDSVTITQPAAPLSVTGIVIDSTACNLANGSINVSVTGGTPASVGVAYTYVWSNGAVTNPATGFDVGDYTVTITDANLCSIDTTIAMVNESNLEITEFTVVTPVLCNGDCNGQISVNVAGGSGTFDYAWAGAGITGNTQNLENVCGDSTYTVTVTDVNTTCTIIDSYTVPQPAVLQIVKIDSTATLCYTDSTGTAIVDAIGGTAPYNFYWTNAANDTLATGANVSNLPYGFINIIAKDANGCQTIDSIFIDRPAQLTATTLYTPTNCGDATGTATVNVSGGTPFVGPNNYQYLWDDANASTTATAENLAAGVYNVTVTDANGCTLTETVIVPDNSDIVITLDSQTATNCFGSCDGSANITVTGGTGLLSYIWTSGETTQNASQLCAGTNYVTVTDENTCSRSIEVIITEPSAIISSTNLINEPLCFGDNNGSAEVLASGGTGILSFEWDNAETTAIATNLTDGKHYVTITDENGCQKTDSVVLTQPAQITFGFTSTQTGCSDSTASATVIDIQGGTGAYTISWAHPEWGSYPAPDSIGQATITNLWVSAFEAFVTDTNGCTVTNTINIDDNSTLYATIENQLNVSCNGNSDGEAEILAHDGAEPYTYNWDNGATTPLVTGLSAGTYQVTIADFNGCSTITVVEITQPEILEVNIVSQSATLCYNDSTGTALATVVGGTAPYNIYWITPANDTIATGLNPGNLPAGNINISVNDANGCQASNSIIIDSPLQIVAVTSSTASDCGVANGTATVSASGGTPFAGPNSYLYLWDDANASTTVTAENLSAGIYNVTITDANGCFIVEQVSVSDNSDIIVSLNSINNISCFGLCDGAAEIGVSGGTGNLSFTWSNGETTQNATQLCEGQNFVVVSDELGCSRVLEVNITGPSKIITTVSIINNPLCSGSADASAQITATGGTGNITFEWDNGTTGQVVSGLAAGKYYVTATDQNLCSVIDSVEFTNPGEITFDVSTINTDCGLSIGSATVENISGGTAPYTVSWAHPEWASYPAPDSINMVTIYNLWVSVFEVIVTDANGCEQRGFVTIDDNSTLVLNIDNITNVTCFGFNDGYALLSAENGVEPYTFDWSNGAVGNEQSNLLSGIYNVTVTDANNCSRSTTITIQEPAQITNSFVFTDPIQCAGETTASLYAFVNGGSGRPYQYMWTNGNGQLISTDSTLFNVPTGIYNLSVTDGNNCTLTDNIEIIEPSPINLSVIQSETECNDSTATASVTVSGGVAPYSYYWYCLNSPAQSFAGQTTNNVSGLWVDMFVVEVTDALGCVATKTVEILDNGGLNFAVQVNKPVWCSDIHDGEAEIINVSSTNISGNIVDFTALWSDGFTGNPNTNLSVGTYYITVTENINGCRAVKSFDMNDDNLFKVYKEAVNNYSQTDGVCYGEAYVYPRGGDISQTNKYIVYWLGNNNDTVKIDTLKTADNNTYSARYDLCEGYYKFIVKNLSLNNQVCQIIDSINITRDKLGYTVLYQNNVLCNGDNTGSVSIQATGGYGNQYQNGEYFYQWANQNWSSYPNADSTNQTITNLVAGRYYFTITDNRGSIINDSIDISEPQLYQPVFDIVKTNCGESVGSITVNEAASSGGTPPFTYLWQHSSWTTDSTGVSITNLNVDIYKLIVTDANNCIREFNINLPDTSNLVLNVDSVWNVSCPGSADGGAIVSAINGTGPYQFTWGNGVNNDTLLNVAAGSYHVRVTDINLCSRVDMVDIFEPVKLQNQFVITKPVVCAGDTEQSMYAAISGGNRPYIYQWENSSNQVLSTDSTITDVTAGWYYLTVYDNNSCLLTDSIEVYNPQPLTLSFISDSTECSEATGWAKAIVNGGIKPYSYAWSAHNDFNLVINGFNSDSIFNLPINKYAVVVTDSIGCSITDTVEIFDIGNINFSFDVIQEVWCNTIKDGKARVINIEHPDSTEYLTNFTALWSDGFIGDTNNNLGVGTYTVTVTENEKGCQRAKTLSMGSGELFRIFKDSVHNYTQNNNICVGEAYVYPRGGDRSLTDKYFVYWLNSNNDTVKADTLIDANANTNSRRRDLCAGYYKFIVRNNRADGHICEIIDSIFIIRDTLRFDTLNLQNIICFGQTNGKISINAIGGHGSQYQNGEYFYQWSNKNWGNYPAADSTGNSISNLARGMYYLTITDNRGSIINDSIEILEPTKVIFESFDFDNPACGDSTGSITVNMAGGVSNYSYKWEHTAFVESLTTQTVTNLWPDDYFLTAADSNGCSTDTLVTLNDSNREFYLDAQAVYGGRICYHAKNGVINVNASDGTSPYKYIWTKNKIPFDTVYTDKLENLSGGEYRVVVTDDKLCRRVDTAFIYEADSVIFDVNAVKNLCYYDTVGTISATNIKGGWDDYTYVTLYTGLGQFYKQSQVSTTITNIPAGNYKIDVDAGGCSSAKLNYTFYSEVPGVDANISSLRNPDCNYESETGHLAIQIQYHYFGNDTIWNSGTKPQYSFNDNPFVSASEFNKAVHGNNTITVRQLAIDGGYCTYNFSKSLTANTYIGVDAYLDDLGGSKTDYYCPADTVDIKVDVHNFDYSPLNADSIIWTNNGYLLGKTDTISVKALNNSSELYVVKAYSNKCYNYDTVNVRKFIINTLNAQLVNPDDSVVFTGNLVELKVDNIVVNDDSSATVESTSNYYWTAANARDAEFTTRPDTVAPIVKAFYSTTFRVIDSVKVQGFDRTCVLYDSLKIEVLPEFDPPKGFSPNGDGHFDEWSLPGVNGYDNITVLIFNRWGGKVWEYSGNSYEGNEFKGLNLKGKTLPSGTYYYIMKYGNEGQLETKTGDVTILR